MVPRAGSDKKKYYYFNKPCRRQSKSSRPLWRPFDFISVRLKTKRNINTDLASLSLFLSSGRSTSANIRDVTRPVRNRTGFLRLRAARENRLNRRSPRLLRGSNARVGNLIRRGVTYGTPRPTKLPPSRIRRSEYSVSGSIRPSSVPSLIVPSIITSVVYSDRSASLRNRVLGGGAMCRNSSKRLRLLRRREESFRTASISH